jgi:outer membrane biosynthesis protein TonB
MSVATAERGLTPKSVDPDGMPGGIALSVALHAIVGIFVVVGLPVLFAPRVPEEAPIAVELVTLGPHTRATEQNEHPHEHASTKKPIEAPPAPKPEPKPAPPKPAPPPTSTAEQSVPSPPEPPKAKPTPAPPQPAPAPTPEPQPKPAPMPKQVAQVEPPRPLEKPKPPPELVKDEPKPPSKQKYNPALFQSLLKNLATEQTSPSEEGRPEPEKAAGRFSSQPKAPLGEQLSASELALIREQIARCWNVPAGARDAKDLVIEIRVVVAPDGTVRQATIMDQARYASDPVFRAAAESARRALFNPLCTPLHLPPDKYDIWKDMLVNFNPKDIL